MRVRVTYQEHTTREAIVVVGSMKEMEEAWDLQYGSPLVDQIEETSTEIDGGIDWNSAQFEQVP